MIRPNSRSKTRTLKEQTSGSQETIKSSSAKGRLVGLVGRTPKPR